MFMYTPEQIREIHEERISQYLKDARHSNNKTDQNRRKWGFNLFNRNKA